MNNFNSKKQYFSEEIVVRNVISEFLFREYGYSLDRKAINLKGGVVFITAQPLIKKRLLRDQLRLRAELLSQEITILAFR